MKRAMVDAALVRWGAELFYSPGRRTNPYSTGRQETMTRRKAAVIRKRIYATVQRVPQVIVKVAGGGRGMTAIAAHFRYISRNGSLEIEDDREVVRSGQDAVLDLVDQWRYGGSFIENHGTRRESLNLMLSMPAGTDPELLKKAVREFAQTELAGHRYVMVLHPDQANPHVHLSAKIEGISGLRLYPGRADLRRWRHTFAEKLRGWGIEADATRQATRGEQRRDEPLWRFRAVQTSRSVEPSSAASVLPRVWHVAGASGASPLRSEAMVSWAHILNALMESEHEDDRHLATDVSVFVRGTTVFREAERRRSRQEMSQMPQRHQTVLQTGTPQVSPPRLHDALRTARKGALRGASGELSPDHAAASSPASTNRTPEATEPHRAERTRSG